jgi:HAD superfamily hydrolase (TIGR01509 family)
MNPGPSRRPRAVIFDMDGLMLDTEPLAARAWAEAAITCDVAFDAQVSMRLVGRTFVDCRTLILAHHGEDYPVDRLMGAWAGAYDAIVEREGLALKAGLLELLDWLEGHAIPKAVATSTRHERARAKLEKTLLLPRFAALVGGDEVAQGKPAPDIFIAAAARLHCAPADALVLEDSEAGLLAAARAGIPSIAVPDVVPSPRLVMGRPPVVMRSLHDVKAHLASLAT